MTPQVYLRKGKEESLMRRHPWIFSGAIDHIKAEDESEITEGALVEIYTRTGDFIALGHYQIGSIAVRVLTFDKEPIDQAWWNRRIAVAYDVRRTLGLTDNPDTDCYRLVHGEGDGLPGLVVDIYGTVAVVQCHSVGMYLARQDIARAILAAYGDRITAIYDKSSQTVPFNARLGAVDGYLWGSSDHSAHVVTENGEKFLVNWEQGQKTGFFLDQRENRELVKRYSKGRTVLNTFCYTGGFSVYAMAGGAEKVCSVDSSERAVVLATENMKLNFGPQANFTETAADAITTILNAYKMSAEEAGTVSDQLFTTVRLGKTTFGELGASIAQVAPIAAAYGISIDQVLGAVASLTKQGTPTAQAMTQIRAAIQGTAGELGDAAFQGRTFQEALQLINEKAGGSASKMKEMLGTFRLPISPDIAS